MLTIRPGTIEDLKSIVAIDNHYIQNSHATFDTEPRLYEERIKWLNNYKISGPYRIFVAEEDNKTLGYCTSSRYRDHKAFDQTIEVSTYLNPDHRSKGLGTALYKKLFDSLKEEPLHLAVCAIALPNEASVQLHKKFGFKEVGVFNEYAIKNGTYINSMWLQKAL